MNIQVDYSKFENIITSDEFDTKKEFFGPPGKEHYQLLSYLSTLYNNVNIIDIGSHRGSSACALSYNPTNTVLSFDIVNNVTNQAIKNLPNVQFFITNIFDNLSNYKDLLMNAPIIFLDIDPHEGYMEYDFYLKLKEWDYQGLLICDDIWHFEGMRNNFWYKVEDQYKYDVTDYGHWSGTGIITCCVNKTLVKYNNDNWTLVTAYFNLAKCPDASDEIKARDQKYYMSHSYSTLSLPLNLVIYCDDESYELIKQIRPSYLVDKTKYIIINFDDLTLNDKTFKEYRDIIINNRKMIPVHDPRNTASYYLFCMSRYIMLKDVIKNNYFNSTHFAWINICMQRMGINNIKKLPEALAVNRDKFSTIYIDYIPKSLIDNNEEYWQYGRCSMCSGFFTGNYFYMNKVCELILNKFLYYLKLGYGHADEQLYSPVYFENQDLFEHYYGDYQQMITNYQYVYDEPEKIIYIFINRSFVLNKVKCLEACEFLIKSLKLNKCTLDQHHLDLLSKFYLHCKMSI